MVLTEVIMKECLVRFLREEDGVTAIEYGVIAGLMAVALVAIFGSGTGSFVTQLKAGFAYIATLIPTTS
jgi:pilus assembly protein Flp/PilA